MTKPELQYGPVQLKFIRITTGEDIISEYQTVNDGEGEYYNLHNPMKVVYMMNPERPTRLTVSLMNWIFPNLVADQSFILHPNDVVTMGTPAQEITQYYYDLVNGKEGREPSDEELEALEKSMEEDGFVPVSEDEVEQIKNFLKKTPAEKKKLLH